MVKTQNTEAIECAKPNILIREWQKIKYYFEILGREEELLTRMLKC